MNHKDSLNMTQGESYRLPKYDTGESYRLAKYDTR